MTSLAANFTTIRQYLRLTQAEMGNILGVSGNVIRHIESGKSEPKLSVLKSLEEAYGFRRADIEGFEMSLKDIEKIIKESEAIKNSHAVPVELDLSEKDILTKLKIFDAWYKTVMNELATAKAIRENINFAEAKYRLNQVTREHLLAPAM